MSLEVEAGQTPSGNQSSASEHRGNSQIDADQAQRHRDLDFSREGSKPPAFSALHLYISHFLSTWNSRLFEMGAVLFVTAISEEILFLVSVYALVRSAAAALLSPAVGILIDRCSRLIVVRASILGQRVSVIASCGLLYLLKQQVNMQGQQRTRVFAVVVLFACLEKVCSVINLVSVERDWVSVQSRYYLCPLLTPAGRRHRRDQRYLSSKK